MIIIDNKLIGWTHQNEIQWIKIQNLSIKNISHL